MTIIEEYELRDGTICVAFVNDDNSGGSMPKADYDAMQAEQSTPSTPQ